MSINANNTNAIGVSIEGIGACVPRTVITNDDLTKLVDTSDEWIATRTGIKQRHVVKGNETVLDLAVAAAFDALESAGMSGSDIDLIIAACSTPDTVYPALCCQLQKAIGADNAAGFDTAMACSGFTIAMTTAAQFLKTGMYKNALVVASDVHSRFVNWYDRNTCVLFGDGAGAVILKGNPGQPDSFLGTEMHLSGDRCMELTLFSPLENCPLVEPYEQRNRYVEMNGREVFKFAVSVVPKSILNTLDQVGMTVNDVDYLVLHQANSRIMDAMTEKLGIPMEKMIMNVDRYGNTSAASIPLALNEAVLDGRIKPGQNLVLCGFGAGLAWGTAVVRWTAVDKRPKRESNYALLLDAPGQWSVAKAPVGVV